MNVPRSEPATAAIESTQVMELDFSSEIGVDLSQVDFQQLKRITIFLPLRSFGVSNSHIDLTSDLLDACWALERLAACTLSLETKIGSGYYQPKIKVTLHDPGPEVRKTLIDCAFVFQEDEYECGQTERIQNLRDEIANFEDVIHTIDPAVPEIVDWYFGNLVTSYGEWQSESPDYYEEQLRRFPERRLGYFKSAFSHRLQGRCYASEHGWLVDSGIDLESFFAATSQGYSLKDFVPCQLLAINGQTMLSADGLLIGFPIEKYLRSQVCASFAKQDDDDEYHSAAFKLAFGQFTLVPEGPTAVGSGGPAAHQLTKPGCFVHDTGTLVFINDGKFKHILYETQPLNLGPVIN